VFIFPSGGRWEVDVDGVESNQHFSSFEEAERYVKREYAAWLVRDETYVSFLMEHMAARKTKTLEGSSVI
jgi:hypothetical protein